MFKIFNDILSNNVASLPLNGILTRFYLSCAKISIPNRKLLLIRLKIIFFVIFYRFI